MGVTIRCGCEVGKNLTLSELKADYRAVLLTVGMSKGATLPMFNNADPVEIAVDFLQRARTSGGNITVPQSALIRWLYACQRGGQQSHIPARPPARRANADGGAYLSGGGPTR